MRDFSPLNVRASIEASTRRLGRPIDLLWLHGAAPAELTDALLATLAEVRAGGLVRAFGLAGRGPELEAALDNDLFTAVMAPAALEDGTGRRRLETLKSAGKEIAAIEIMAGVTTAGNAPSAGALWRWGRRRLGRAAPAGPAAAGVTAPERLAAVLADDLFDLALTTTTLQRRLRANLETAATA